MNKNGKKLKMSLYNLLEKDMFYGLDVKNRLKENANDLCCNSQNYNLFKYE